MYENLEWFPTNVMRVNSKDLLGEREKISEILEEAESLSVFSVKGETHEHKQAYIPSVMKKLKEIFKEYCKVEGEYKIKVWYRNMKDGDHCILHCHPRALCSFVFFLREPLEGGELVFMDPRVQVRIGQHHRSFEAYKEIKPEEGVGYVFPGWLDHYVNPCKGERMTLVANVMSINRNGLKVNHEA